MEQGVAQGQAFVAAIKKPPVLLSLISASLLIFFYCFGTLNFWSPMGGSVAYDTFTLPRCGLAIRFGTDPFTSSADYPFYGNFATNWASHPLLCVVAGAPLSYLSPGLEQLVTTSLYCILHFWILVSFGARLAPAAVPTVSESRVLKAIWQRLKQWHLRDYLFFSAAGFFFPWYVMLVLGQYHAIVVFALAAILLSERNLVLGFVLSAIGKPVLAPAALALFAARKWRIILIISAICALCYLPWLVLRYDVPRGLHLGMNESFIKFFEVSSRYTRFSVVGWNQEMGWSKIFDEFANPNEHFPFRVALAALPVMLAVWLGFQKKLQLAIAVSVLWFFFLYGRGHEYHYTLALPLLAFLYCHESGRYRTAFTAVIAMIAAAPTVFPLIMGLHGFPTTGAANHAAMKAANPFLFWIYLLHKPIIAPLILVQVFWVEKNQLNH